jgi:hypothetical protein
MGSKEDGAGAWERKDGGEQGRRKRGARRKEGSLGERNDSREEERGGRVVAGELR